MLKFTEKLFGWCDKLLMKFGFNEIIASYLGLLVNLVILFAISYFLYIVFRFILVTIMAIVARKTKTKFDDLLVSNQTAKYISHLIPLIYVYKSVPVILENFNSWESIFGKLVGIYIILLVLWIIRTVFNVLRDHLKTIPSYSDKPIDSYIQVIMIILWMIGFTAILSKLFEIEIRDLLTTFGAISAIILLIFRDTILGFVASIQVSVNDMVRIGDWITMDKFGADGDVIEINLATVKVRNFDNTTTTIPTYSLISDSFRNWRGMLNADGRRIKRHILIKSSSIRFVKEEELEDFKQIQLIKTYIEKKQADINKYNLQYNVDKSLSVNGRNLTNFGLFRKYLTNYLENYPSLNKDMILLCRHLQPTAQGVPLEIYAFTSDKRFENYEYIMSDIFDHILASVVYFDLEIFEMPSHKNGFTEA
ncbi:mechanosensitive ion channel [Flavobacterium psychrophilum]|uniref:Mechanosensing system component YbdG n=2 Tax=Flavobacterium psychrophilum TaxID=96345 RepID=A6GY70_FLAPJ|nr:mechanosensitive ion channel domain-containing protein [Flavobacterium psychrophilum]AIG29763.1 mechanosensitive ion channel protein MscS [Flavobacterium psychrophilum]AIG32040.1 mechanosensitive ion channel protein MscS [Flavobacterium psychrophilum]AIG34195.1 mechanosensitive ion channel protein MscS [Flavobacterium psychrophilum]AIG36558.1 mechanosensitive ion channel protein MscS [Flavobacterium psychrophilum]AIG38823.1 mechanosensitive ion channel protein MscS [Flavobacterium psychroph